jgi:hypothetical protein
LNPLVSSCFCIVYTKRELAAVCLCLCLNSLSLLLSKLATVSSFFLIVNTFQVHLNNLSLVCLRRFGNERKALCKGLVLKLYISCFLRVRQLILSRIEAVGRWEGGDSSIKLRAKLSCHSFTSRLSKDRFHS